MPTFEGAMSDQRREAASLTDMDRESMERLAVSMGEPAFRGHQLFHWVHRRLETDLDRMSNLPRQFRAQLALQHSVARAELIRELISSDGQTRKRLLRLADGETVETVLMDSPEQRSGSSWRTVCVSSQVGCALGCSFCTTGQVGFTRQLSPGEIVEQVYHFERELRGEAAGSPRDGRPRLVDNVVFMGMGEPLANYEAVMSAVRLLTSAEGLAFGARHITISTAGLVPEIDRLSIEGMQLGLAISLHAARDALRTRIMPINRRYPVGEVVSAGDRYSARTGRRVTYEYALMAGVNDSDSHARDLVGLLAGRLCHVNLIPLNVSLEGNLAGSSPQRLASFCRVLQQARIPCTIRQSKGQDITAACGQLGRAAEDNRSPTGDGQ